MPMGPLDVQPADTIPVWTTAQAVRAANDKVPADRDLSDAIRFASSLLFRLSGRQYGTRQVTVRPTRSGGCGCGCSCGRWLESTAWWDGTLHTTWQGPPPCGRGCVNRCSTTTARLPGPIRSVQQVVVAGVELDTSAYRLTSRYTLARVDGERWPCEQNLLLPSDVGADREGTWQVSYTRGRPIPEGGKTAAAHLAAQITLAEVGSAACKLPARVTSIIRQDVTMAFQDSMEFLKDGRTGLYVVDEWLGSVNPQGLRRNASIHVLRDC